MAEKPRFLFIDLLRGWAILVMIEVHVVNSMLLQSIKDQSWFGHINFINGLVAPSFLFISGFAFVISSTRGIDEMRKFKLPFWKKLSRILLILVIGYSLHVPYFSFTKIIRDTSYEQLVAFYNVDVLQNIAAGLIFIFMLRIAIKSDRLFNIIITATAFFFAVAAPYYWSIDLTKYMPLPLANYFNPQNGSFFPLFPWISFILFGAIISHYYLKAREINEEKRFIINLAFAGIFMIGAGHFYLSDIFPESYRLVTPHPVFFFQRLGYVLAMLCLCWYYVNRKTDAGVSTFNKYVIATGRESLLIYWLHLQVIYRRLWNGKSFESIADKSYNLWECFIATIILIVLMIIAAKYWGMLKSKNRKAASYITAGVLTIATIIFLLNVNLI